MGIIKDLPVDRLRNLVESHTSYTGIMKTLGLATSGDSLKVLKNRIIRENIDTSHFFINKGRKEEIPLLDLLVNGRDTSSKDLKKKLIKGGYLKEICSECGIGNIWNNKPITLHLDHINGDHSDNRLENLRIICPNCHSQTKTFGTRRLKKDSSCKFCGRKIDKKSIRCRSCAAKQTQKRKVENRPSKEELKKLLITHSYVGIGKLYGVSDNTIRKWMK